MQKLANRILNTNSKGINKIKMCPSLLLSVLGVKTMVAPVHAYLDGISAYLFSAFTWVQGVKTMVARVHAYLDGISANLLFYY